MKNFIIKHKKIIILTIIIFIFNYFTQVEYFSDDFYNRKDVLDVNPLLYGIKQFQTWSGRFLVEIFLAIFLKLDLSVFLLFLSFMSALFIESIKKIIKSDNQYLTIGLLLLVITITNNLGYLDAGIIGTNLNYFILYSFVSYGLVNFFHLYRNENKQINILSLIALTIGCSSEQCIALVGGIVFSFNVIYWLKNKTINQKLLYFLIPVFICLSIYLLSPGVENRSIIEMQQVPQYIDYSLITRIKIGFGYLNDYYLLLRINGLLILVLIFISFKNKKYIGLLFSIITLLVLYYQPNNELLPTIEEMSYFNQLCVNSILIIFLTMLSILFTLKRNILEIMILILGGYGTKIMLGLSPTYYRSGARTFSLMIIIFITISLYLIFKEFYERND